MSSTWSEISLGSDDEQVLSGRVRSSRGSRSTLVPENIENDIAQKQLTETLAKSDEGTVLFFNNVASLWDSLAFSCGESRSTWRAILYCQ